MDLARELVRLGLEAEGAAVEEAGGDLYALLPPPLAASLDLGEEVRVAFGTGREAEEGVADGRLGSRLVERLAERQLTSPPFAAVALPPELPRRLPANAPVLLNAVAAGEPATSTGFERYVVAELRLQAQSDEMRSQIATVCVRAGDGARVSVPDLTRGDPRDLAPLDEQERRRLAVALRTWLQREGVARMSGAFESVRRRLHRDLESMADFYRGLDADMAAAVRRVRSADERQRREAKRAALGADLSARREQLRERTRLRFSAAVVAATLIESQAQRFTLPVRRRQKSGKLAILCRSADSTFEGPGCDACGAATLRLYLCDERLHVLCDACGQAGRLDAARCPACWPAPRPAPRISVLDPTAGLDLGTR
jgi:hypothetical protein